MVKNLLKHFINLYMGKINFVTFFTVVKRIFSAKCFPLLFISLSYRCNLSCYYCFTKGLNKEFPNDMRIEDFYKLIKWLKRQSKFNLNRRRLVFVGGEPTIYPQFGKILDICKKESLKISFFTNNLFNNSIAEKLNKNYIKKIHINYNPPSFYSKENYKLFEDNLNKIYRKNIKIFLYHKISKNNNVDHLLKTAKKYNAMVELSLFIPGFSWKNFSLEKTKKLSQETINIVSRCRKEKISCMFARPVLKCTFTDDQWEDMYSKELIRSICFVGHNNHGPGRLMINPDLSIFPCTALWLKGPNILSFKNFKEVDEFYKKTLQKLRWKPLMENCKTCKYFINKQCQGGCLNYKIKQNIIISMENKSI